MTGIIDVENVSKCLSAFPLFQRVNDLDETCTRVGEAIRPHSLKVLGVGHRLNARMDRLPLNAVTIHRLSYQAEVSVVSDPPNNFFLLMQRYRNMSPKAFLRNARLDRVHAELVAARQEGRDVTVTQIAMSLGFTHLGHFTKAYFAKYNELPSVTLRKYQKSQ